MQFLTFRPWRGLGLHCALVMGLFAVMLAGCTSALPKVPPKAAATYRVKVDVRYRGLQRNYLVHLPPGYNDQNPLPMVVVLHGAFGNARITERISGFSDLADEKQFVAIYPNGIGLLGNFQHWNAGHCCSVANKEDVDDVGFIATVIEDASSRLAVDRRRIFMVGFSNGGMLAYRFAAERGEVLAAFAPLAASAGGRPDSNYPEWSIPRPVKPLPVIAFHGLDDSAVPFKGGFSPSWDPDRKYWSVMRSLGIWIKRNGCTASPVEKDQRQGKVHVRYWKSCKGNNNVVLYTLKGWPHEWPSNHNSSRLDPQDLLYGFDAPHIIWDFFESVSR